MKRVIIVAMIFLGFSITAQAQVDSFTIKNKLPGVIHRGGYSGQFARLPARDIPPGGRSEMKVTFYFFKTKERHVKYSYDLTLQGVRYQGTCDLGVVVLAVLNAYRNKSHGCTGIAHLQSLGATQDFYEISL